MEFLIIPYVLMGLLGVWLARGWLAGRPRLGWAVVAVGAASLVAMFWMNALLSVTLGPALACLAAGVALAKTPMPGWARFILLCLFSGGVLFYGSFVCAPDAWNPGF